MQNKNVKTWGAPKRKIDFVRKNKIKLHRAAQNIYISKPGP